MKEKQNYLSIWHKIWKKSKQYQCYEFLGKQTIIFVLRLPWKFQKLVSKILLSIKFLDVGKTWSFVTITTLIKIERFKLNSVHMNMYNKKN